MSVLAPLRVHQTTTTTGTGTVNLTAAVANLRNFNAAYSTGAKVPYCITDDLSAYEIGIGTLTTGSPDTISRDTIILSSNSNSAVSFGAGTKQIFAWELGSAYISTFSGTTTAALADWGNTFVFTGSSTTVFNLPALSTVPKGYTVSIKNSGTGNITTTPNGSDAIEGLSGGATVAQTPQTSATYSNDGTVWRQTTVGVNWPVSVGDGGTGLTIGTSGGVPYFSSTTAIASSGALATNAIVVGGGAGATPTTDSDWTISSHTLSGPGVDSITTNNLLLVKGATKGIRQYCTSAGGFVEGVDNTGAATYQPFNVGGSTMALTLSGVSKATLDSTSGWQAPGTGTNNSASAGNIGEFVSANLAAASAVSLSNATSANITSISLTAGDWDVSGNAVWVFSAPANLIYAIVAITTTSATLPTAPNSGSYSGITSATQTFNNVNAQAAGTIRISIASTTTVYLVTDASFSSGTVTAYGFIGARRAR